MFGKQFAYEYAGYAEEQRTPPWLRQRGHHRHPHFSGMLRRYGFFGPAQSEWGGRWTPPWLSEEWRRPHFVGMRRGPRPVGPRGPRAFGGQQGRVLGERDGQDAR